MFEKLKKLKKSKIRDGITYFEADESVDEPGMYIVMKR